LAVTIKKIGNNVVKYAVTKNGQSRELFSDVQLAAFKNSGWTEVKTSAKSPDGVVSPDGQAENSDK
jgi:hypothetical protein